MNYIKIINLILDNPANNLTTTSRDLLDTMKVAIELQEEKGDLSNVFLNYDSLGYDACFTTFFGKDAVRLTKRYSHKAEKPLHCEQIFNKESKTENDLREVFDFMYNDIKEQEDTGNYRKPLTIKSES